MKAKIKAIQILTLIVVVLAICAGLLAVYQPAGDSPSETQAVYPITEIPVNQVAALTLSNANCSLGLLMNGAELEVVSQVEGNYSQTELRSLVYLASHLTGSRKIADFGDGADYGLDQPQASITLILTDNSRVNLALLAENPLDGTYYIYVEDAAGNQEPVENQDAAGARGTIYVIAAEAAEMFLRDEMDFFSHIIFPEVDSNNYSLVESVSVEYGDQGIRYSVENKASGFYLTQPYQQRLPVVATVQQLLLPISALYSDEFVAAGVSADDLTQYGFGEGSLRISMRYDGQAYSALLADQGDGTCLMADENSGDVYRLGSESMDGLLLDCMQLLGGKAFSYAAGDVQSVAVAAAGENVLVSPSAGEKESQLFSVVNQASIAKAVWDREENAGAGIEPEVSLTFTMRSGSVELVELLPAGDEEYYARVNGVVNFTVDRSFVTAVTEALAAFTGSGE